MTSNDKEQPSKIHCLFHQKIDCSCINPVTNDKILIERLEHHLKLNQILNRYEADEAKKDERNRQSILYEDRLSDLRN